MTFAYDDGGRAAAGYKGNAGDCAARSIAIATELPYQYVYDGINAVASRERRGKRKRGVSNARTGVYGPTIRKYMKSLGWRWVPTMAIGTGCRVHLTDGELPMGRLVVCVSRHYTAVVDGVIHDTHDPQRESETVYERKTVRNPDGPGWIHIDIPRQTGGRCVYGYFVKD